MTPESKKIPAHVGIIMDGNGRWARNRGFHRSIGHAKGSSIVKNIIETARLSGVQVLSLYCFSTENWSRSNDEIDVLMELLRDYLLQEREDLAKGNIKVNLFGQLSRLPATVQEVVNGTIEITRHNTGMVLNFCVSYGGRAELIEAIKKIADSVSTGETRTTEITEALISKNLYTAGLPDPDLIIRTSGEFRTSNFLLWQSAYAEFYVTDTLWPDFTEQEFHKALEWYSHRKRRFGHSDEKASNARLRQNRLIETNPEAPGELSKNS